MIGLDFLKILKKERKLELVEPSEQISKSYANKSLECRDVAHLALKNNYHESAIILSYYSMYNNVLSLFFRCGIKCENHSAAEIILKDFFMQEELSMIFARAKAERIDRQYYIAADGIQRSALDMIIIAMKFNPQILAIKDNLKLEDIKRIRKKLTNSST